ncbi:MAG: glycine zipper domain-containing protein, partial [Pirellulaceae bacterium]
MKRYAKFAARTTLLASIACSGSLGQAQTKDGAILGGVAGAVIGGIVGHQNDETPEGALIGGAVGAITGGMIGNYRQQQQRLRYYEQQRYS